MADESCPERVRLVEELGEAINEQKHAKTDVDRLEAGIRMEKALQAVRPKKAKRASSNSKVRRPKVS